MSKKLQTVYRKTESGWVEYPLPTSSGGSGESNVDDIQINGTSILSNKIANITTDNSTLEYNTNLLVKDAGITKSKLADEVINNYTIDNDNSSIKFNNPLTEDQVQVFSIKTKDGVEVLNKEVSYTPIINHCRLGSSTQMEINNGVLKVDFYTENSDFLFDKSINLLENLILDCGEIV